MIFDWSKSGGFNNYDWYHTILMIHPSLILPYILLMKSPPLKDSLSLNYLFIFHDIVFSVAAIIIGTFPVMEVIVRVTYYIIKVNKP